MIQLPPSIKAYAVRSVTFEAPTIARLASHHSRNLEIGWVATDVPVQQWERLGSNEDDLPGGAPDNPADKRVFGDESDVIRNGLTRMTMKISTATTVATNNEAALVQKNAALLIQKRIAGCRP
jgi:hypothetical protein